MHAIWVSLKEKVYCGNKLTDVIRQPEKFARGGRCVFEKENSEDDRLVRREVISRQCHLENWYYELNIGDPSRNIVEMIFGAASAHPSKHCRKIKKVLRVNNSIEIVERFEQYRRMVKKRAREQHKRHPRSMVDGNELLQFYGTTMNCCSGKPTRVSDACKDLTCRVCRIIQSGFTTAYFRKNGIRLSTSSEELSEDMITITRGKNVKRAVIVCRTIAGKVANAVDEKSQKEYDSIKTEGLHSKSEYLIVQNPSAVFPCFVVVFICIYINSCFCCRSYSLLPRGVNIFVPLVIS